MIHEVLSQVATARPDSTALIHRGAHVSYGVLDHASDALAARLRNDGVKPGCLIPVLSARSPEWVAALLAVLKCGAGYAALDPAWPNERIAQLTEQLDPPLTVAAAPHADRVSGPLCQLEDLASILADAAAVAGGLPPVSVTGDDISTVFLTSGSSGEPKAVLSPHRATVRMFVDCDFARFDRSTVMPQGSPMPWDGASLELWGPLLTGGTSVLLDEPHLSPALLRQLIAADGVNTVFLTTSLFNVLVEEDVAAFHGLRAVMTGGEKLSVFHIRRFRQAHPGIGLISAYGPVESTIFTTTHVIADADAASEAIPLGRPVHHTTVAVFDGDRGCPPGDVGEICVAGAGLAQGYLAAPELTARSFVTLDVDGAPTRMYRTGDFGHLSQDGVLHFAGRRDRQVKVRGHRVEPEEIERQMLSLAGVTRAVVVPVRDAAGACRKLAGFYTGDPDAPSTDEVGSALRRRLPRYLVPEVLRRAPRIPLSATGKADHARLLATLAEPAEGDLPRDELERTVAAEFAAVLDTSPIGRSTGFFDAGGTSLDALRLNVRLARRQGRPIPQSALITAPTVAALAAALRDAGWSAGEPAGVAPGGRTDGAGVPLNPMQRAFWLTSMLEPASAASQCVSVWRRVTIAPEVLAQALQDVCRRHPGLRARVVLTEAPTAVVPDDFVPPTVDILHPDGDPLAEMLDRLHEPFDLQQGPLCRAAIAAEPSGEGWLFGFAVHHAFYDEWAEQRLIADLLTAAAAREAGRVPAYSRPAPSLAQVHECYHAQLRLVDLEGQRSYWVRKLHDAPRLPAVAPDTPVLASQVLDPVTVAFSAETMTRWEKLARSTGAAASHVVLAALAEAISSVAGARDLVIGVMVAKRGHPTLADAVTCLMDPVCVRLRDCGEGLLTTLAACQSEMIGAMSHQDVSVSELSHVIGADQARGRPPYDVLFVLQHQPHPRLGSGEPEPLFQPTSRELVAEARPQPDGGLTMALLHADQPGLRSVAEQIARAASQVAAEA